VVWFCHAQSSFLKAAKTVTDPPTQFDRNDWANGASRSATNTDAIWPPSESSRQLDRAKKFARTINSIGLALAIWAMFFPRPNPVMILLLFIPPLIAVGLATRSRGLYQITAFRGDVRPDLSMCFLGCGTALCVRALRDINIYPLYWTTIITCAVFVGGLLTLLVVSMDAKTREGGWALILVGASVFGYGAIGEADVLLDGSIPKTSEVLVFSKYSNSHARGPAMWHLHVAKWGPFAASTDVSVPGPLYQCISAGQTVCIKVYRGALNIPWYDVAICK